MNEFKIHKISKLKLVKINEDDLMFITNPGRMGDEDRLTFIIKKGNIFTIYRVDGLLYPKEDILLEDIKKQFPKWADTWKYAKKKEFKGKYKYLYMGFGNGLSVDISIYDEFMYYLDNLLENQNEDLDYVRVFNNWEKAFTNMVKDKKYIIK